jgi:hypothetical protein
MRDLLMYNQFSGWSYEHTSEAALAPPLMPEWEQHTVLACRKQPGAQGPSKLE